MLERLEAFAVEEPARRAGEDHPMRQVTRSVAADAAAWDPAMRTRVQGIFDSLAPDWHTRHTEERLAPLRDALERGEPRAGRCVELGCGTGPATQLNAAPSAGLAPLERVPQGRESLLGVTRVPVRRQGIKDPLHPGAHRRVPRRSVGSDAPRDLPHRVVLTGSARGFLDRERLESFQHARSSSRRPARTQVGPGPERLRAGRRCPHTGSSGSCPLRCQRTGSPASSASLRA